MSNSLQNGRCQTGSIEKICNKHIYWTPVKRIKKRSLPGQSCGDYAKRESDFSFTLFSINICVVDLCVKDAA